MKRPIADAGRQDDRDAERTGSTASRGRGPPFLHDEPGAERRREAVDQLRREVEVRGQQDERLGDDHHAERGRGLRGVAQVPRS